MVLVLCIGAAIAAAKMTDAGTNDGNSPDGDDENLLLGDDLEGKTSVELLPLERTLASLEAPIATITFFEAGGGVDEVVEYLRKRVADIAYANPFLGGWLARNSRGGGDVSNIRLVYDESSDDLAPNLFVSYPPGQIDLSRHTPYVEYDRLLRNAKATVQRNADLIGRKNESLWRVALIPDAAESDLSSSSTSRRTRFALVMSMSHVCGDAHTFYQVYNMLSANRSVVALNPKRKLDFSSAVMDRMGSREAFYVKNACEDRNLWQRMMRKARDEPDEGRKGRIFVVSDEWIAQRKAEAVGTVDGAADFGGTTLRSPMALHELEGPLDDDGGRGSGSISTNDVLTSWFWNAVGASVGLMSYNFRNRLPMCQSNDAGNYQNPIPYAAEDFATPELIRKSLRNARRCGADANPPTPLPLPGGPDVTFSVSSNWSSFLPRDFAFDCSTGGDCRQEAHFPLYFPSDIVGNIPSKTSLVIIFSIAPGKVGVFMLAPLEAVAKIDASGVIEEVIATF